MLHAAVHTPNDTTRWDDLRGFLAVLRQGSFSGAATVLGIEQSTVSRRIAALEASFGAPLFDRAPGGPRATALALELRDSAERVEREVQGLLDQATAQHGTITGRVRLATTESFAVHVLMPQVLGGLRARYPGLHLDLLLGERSADLSQREADLALRFYRPREGDLVAKRVLSMSTAVIGNARYLRERPTKLESLDWIVLDHEHTMRDEVIQLLERAKVEPALRTNGHLAQVEAVRAGLGVAMLATPLLRLDPDLRVVDLGLPPGPTLELWLVAPSSLIRVPRVRAVWEYLEQRLIELESEAQLSVP